jgi:hypothetical protein
MIVPLGTPLTIAFAFAFAFAQPCPHRCERWRRAQLPCPHRHGHRARPRRPAGQAHRSRRSRRRAHAASRGPAAHAVRGFRNVHIHRHAVACSTPATSKLGRLVVSREPHREATGRMSAGARLLLSRSRASPAGHLLRSSHRASSIDGPSSRYRPHPSATPASARRLRRARPHKHRGSARRAASPAIGDWRALGPLEFGEQSSGARGAGHPLVAKAITARESAGRTKAGARTAAPASWFHAQQAAAS